jgi:hypothetical protein
MCLNMLILKYPHVPIALQRALAHANRGQILSNVGSF